MSDRTDHDRIEQCEMCLRELSCCFVHYNGAFLQCEGCSTLEELDPDDEHGQIVTGIYASEVMP